MKKDFISSKFLLSILLLVFIQATAQKTTNTQKTSGKEIIISITGTEYDDAGVIKLRETIKLNMKVKEVNPGYSGGTAKISVTYNGKATELWDELPQTVKQLFKVTAIDNINIGLKKDDQKQTEILKTTTTTTTKKEECVNCNYYKDCRFDTTLSFDGVIYKGMKSGSQKGYYYACENGSLLRKYLGTDKKYYSQILFKSNEPVGTSWAYTIQNGDTYRHMIVAKGIAIKIGNNTYNDVMIVNNNYVTIFRNDYYAKDVGLVKSDTLDKNYNPLKAINMRGNVDQSIVGLWKHHNTVVDMNLYYKFNGDGTYEYYAGAVHPVNQMPKGKCYWRINGNILELYSGEWNDLVKVTVQKKNDLVTGKPTLIIQAGATENRSYFSEDGKEQWK
ncbi:MAG: hypothetical protein ABR503_11350 [Chitinophagaceae bacterium]